MPKSTNGNNPGNSAGPDYLGLLAFLVKPLLEDSEALSIDCEWVNNNQRVWIRLAFEDSDKGRVYGRGGRNLQSISTVLTKAAMAAGQSLCLDVYEDSTNQNSRPNHRRRQETDRQFAPTRPRSDRQNMPKLSIRSRWQEE
ncbi:KH domain-containing protein [Crocosphaera sp. XPORK-15E]|uniref:KH domain-containing protein n=1 Tax=Crocosphaera sp. XPORK-15E TaxID=3110247 RepID=UPI002B216102|nr:KH domain-containing protein [Crocosphaera sp. XPORK-15E]MEA5532852.1 KH domain-containing protein [Crocosphaera sp. XPORK-15E]